MGHCRDQQHDDGGDRCDGKLGVDRCNEGKRGYREGENGEQREFARMRNQHADGAAVDAAVLGLELVDDLHGTDLGGAAQRARRKGRAQDVERVAAGREPGKTGVWTDRRKLASIGIACRRWITFHGLALNVATDLGYFARINPCGFDAAVMTSMSHELGHPVELAPVADRLVAELAAVLDRRLG